VLHTVVADELCALCLQQHVYYALCERQDNQIHMTRLRVLENGVLRKIFKGKTEE
jgi:hypothetical protein